MRPESQLLALLGLLLLASCQERLADDKELETSRSPLAEVVSRTRLTPYKLLLVGIDGGSFEVLEPLWKAGRAPHLEKLAKEGVRGTLESQLPMLSPAIWTTLATGHDRLQHGIDNFAVPVTSQGATQPRLVASTDRRTLALWNLLGPFGRSVGVAGWWATYPAEPVHGWILSDRMTRSRWLAWTRAQREGPLTFPSPLAERLAGHLIDPAEPPWAELQELAPFSAQERREMEAVTQPLFGHGLSVLKFAWCTQRSFEEMVLELLGEGQPDVTMVFLIANDPVSHTFWHFYQPEAYPVGSVDGEKAERLGRLVPALYEHNDRYLGRLLEKVDDDTVVFVVSDHGFQADAEVPRQEPFARHRAAFDKRQRQALRRGTVAVGQSGMHHQDGLFLACGGPLREGVTVDARIHDIIPTVLALLGLPVPEDMPGRVLEEIFRPEFLREYPLQRIESYETLIPRERLPAAGSMGDDEALEMLRALGYIK